MLIEEIFRDQIRDHRGQRPPVRPLNLKSDPMNFGTLAEKKLKKNNENRPFVEFSGSPTFSKLFLYYLRNWVSFL